MKVEVAVLDSPSVIARTFPVDVKQHWTRWLVELSESSAAVLTDDDDDDDDDELMLNVLTCHLTY